MNTRDTKEFRHKGKETTTVKAKTGLVEYTRTKYITKDETGKNRYALVGKEYVAGYMAGEEMAKILPRILNRYVA